MPNLNHHLMVHLGQLMLRFSQPVCDRSDGILVPIQLFVWN